MDLKGGTLNLGGGNLAREGEKLGRKGGNSVLEGGTLDFGGGNLNLEGGSSSKLNMETDYKNEDHFKAFWRGTYICLWERMNYYIERSGKTRIFQ
mgnify:FL=1